MEGVSLSDEGDITRSKFTSMICFLLRKEEWRSTLDGLTIYS